MPRDLRWKGIHTRYGEPSGCCGAGTRSWTLWSAKCQRSVLYFCEELKRIPSLAGNTYWPSCRMLSLIDVDGMVGEEE